MLSPVGCVRRIGKLRISLRYFLFCSSSLLENRSALAHSVQNIGGEKRCVLPFETSFFNSKNFLLTLESLLLTALTTTEASTTIQLGELLFTSVLCALIFSFLAKAYWEVEHLSLIVLVGQKVH